jgi:vitamin B12 transporter
MRIRGLCDRLFASAFALLVSQSATAQQPDAGGPADAAVEEPVQPTAELVQPTPELVPPAVVPSPAPPVGDANPVEVAVQGRSRADRLRESAQAVQVIDTEQARRQSADLGEILARSHGVSVRRDGGLGSGTRLSLNGLIDDQVRVFLDGLPLRAAGYPFGIGNVPTNLVERIEVYRGVVPVRFGADALGGAINLVSDEALQGTRAAASYQLGSFGTHRITASGRTLHAPSGYFARAVGFFDVAANDYPVTVDVADTRGRETSRRVYRFHDGYRAAGVNVETGWVDRPWARRLLLRGFLTDYRKELQNNVSMTVPYADREFSEWMAGGTLRYQQSFAHGLSLEAVGGYSFGRLRSQDPDRCSYDWYGNCLVEKAKPDATDLFVWEQTALARVHAQWRIHPQHVVRLTSAPTYVARTARDRADQQPKTREQGSVTSLVSGLEYQADLLAERIENIAFAKSYLQWADTGEDVFAVRDRSTRRFGFGDALRVRIVDALYAKASYEWATRLPRPDEVFGDGQLQLANVELEPEQSHNGNLSLVLDVRDAPSGSWSGEINGFVRNAARLIVLLESGDQSMYMNVYGARALGFEAAASWTAPGQYVSLAGNATYLDLRNTATEGAFASFEGDRIPNRPYFFANGSARFQLRDVATSNDELALTWTTRYVHAFYRSWESIGQRSLKKVIDAQLVHAIALVYLVRGDARTISHALEIQNLTDARVFDYFGAQRPGRAVYYKLVIEL